MIDHGMSLLVRVLHEVAVWTCYNGSEKMVVHGVLWPARILQQMDLNWMYVLVNMLTREV